MTSLADLLVTQGTASAEPAEPSKSYLAERLEEQTEEMKLVFERLKTHYCGDPLPTTISFQNVSAAELKRQLESPAGIALLSRTELYDRINKGQEFAVPFDDTGKLPYRESKFLYLARPGQSLISVGLRCNVQEAKKRQQLEGRLDAAAALSTLDLLGNRNAQAVNVPRSELATSMYLTRVYYMETQQTESSPLRVQWELRTDRSGLMEEEHVFVLDNESDTIWLGFPPKEDYEEQKGELLQHRELLRRLEGLFFTFYQTTTTQLIYLDNLQSAVNKMWETLLPADKARAQKELQDVMLKAEAAETKRRLIENIHEKTLQAVVEQLETIQKTKKIKNKATNSVDLDPRDPQLKDVEKV